LENYYQTTRCNSPEDGHLHTRRTENTKSLGSFIHLREDEGKGIKKFSAADARSTSQDSRRLS
jgi:hypothetical protein